MSDEEPAARRFQGDHVTRYGPVSFALAFVQAMRKRGELSQVPSVRTSITAASDDTVMTVRIASTFR